MAVRARSSRSCCGWPTRRSYDHAGAVDFVDNRVNGNTGTIRAARRLPEPAARLQGRACSSAIRLPIGKPYQALLIPDEALLSDQGRKYVYVVNDENEVEYRAVDARARRSRGCG